MWHINLLEPILLIAIVVVVVEVILIRKMASFGPVYTKTIGGILKQQLNDLLHGGRDIPDKAK